MSRLRLAAPVYIGEKKCLESAGEYERKRKRRRRRRRRRRTGGEELNREKIRTVRRTGSRVTGGQREGGRRGEACAVDR